MRGGQVDRERPRARTGWRGALTGSVLLLVAAGLVHWSARNGAETIAAARSLGVLPLVGATVLAAVGTLIAAVAWRAGLDGLGAHLPRVTAIRICLVGQLGKYLPGSLWPALVQAELAQRRGVPRATVVAAFVMSLGASLSAGAVVGAIAVTRAGNPGWSWPLIVVVLCSVAFTAIFIRPRLLTALMIRGLARVGRRPVPDRMPDAAVRRCLGLSVLGWVVTGLHVWVLVVALGADPIAALPRRSAAWPSQRWSAALSSSHRAASVYVRSSSSPC